MIDIDNARKQFKKYVEQFNPSNGRIKLKIEIKSKIYIYREWEMC